MRKHEDGHRDIAIDAVTRRDARAWRACAGIATARSLKQNLSHIADTTLKEYREEKDSYDVTTMHGRTQGATFP